MAAHFCVEDYGELIASVARKWIGTPYRHQASCKGIGADCLGLVRGVWREIVGLEPEVAEGYSPDWAEATTEEALLDGLLRHLVPVSQGDVLPGDVLLFRMLERGPAKHTAILSKGQTRDNDAEMIHAYSGHSVCTARFSLPWQRRLVAACRLPEPV